MKLINFHNLYNIENLSRYYFFKFIHVYENFINFPDFVSTSNKRNIYKINNFNNENYRYTKKIIDKVIITELNSIYSAFSIHCINKYIEYIRQYKHKLDWKSICRKYKFVNDEQIIEFEKYINWRQLISYQYISDNIIEKYKDKLDWSTMSKYHALTYDTIVKYRDRLYLVLVNENDNISYFDKLKLQKNFKLTDNDRKKHFLLYTSAVAVLPS